MDKETEIERRMEEGGGGRRMPIVGAKKITGAADFELNAV